LIVPYQDWRQACRECFATTASPSLALIVHKLMTLALCLPVQVSHPVLLAIGDGANDVSMLQVGEWLESAG